MCDERGVAYPSVVILPSFFGSGSHCMLAERISQACVRGRWILLAAALLATAVAWFVGSPLDYDRSIDNMFAKHDPLLPPYARLKRTFGGDEVVLAAYVDPRGLTAAMGRLASLTDRLAKVEGVESAFSLGATPLPARFLVPSRLGEPFLKLMEGYAIGADRQTLGVVCTLEPEARATVPRSETIDRLREIVEAHDPSGVLTGEPVMVVDAFRYLQSDGRVLGAAATALLMVTLVFCFRSLRWVLAPMAVVYATLLWTQASLAAAGFRLTMVSSMLWAMVTVIGVGMAVHVIVAFREQRAAGLGPVEALRTAGARLAGPIFWSCATDAVGFGALTISHVGPVYDFGAMMAVVSGFTLVAIVAVMPGLSLWGRFDADPRRAWGEPALDAGLSRLVRLVDRRPLLVGLLAFGSTAAAAAGAYKLDVETDFTKNFLPSSSVVRAYDFVETRLGGAGVWDVVVPVPETGHAEFLRRMVRLEERLRREVRVDGPDGTSEPGLTKVLSLVDVFGVPALLDLAQGSSVDDLLAESYPGLTARLGQFADSLKIQDGLDPLQSWLPVTRALYGGDPEQAGRPYVRIMLRARERQPSSQKQRLIERTRAIVAEEFPEAEVTGFFVLLTRLIESMLRDQWITFGVACAGIGLTMFAAFRSLPLALAALVPNAMPVLVMTGLLGWLELPMNMGAAMIASVSMGMAVDSSVHYIAAFLRARAAGRDVSGALHAAHHSAGRAVVLSTLALVAGFSALALSNFVPTIYFGVLVGLSMVGGMAGNLIVLPLLLKCIYRDRTPAPLPGAPRPGI